MRGVKEMFRYVEPLITPTTKMVLGGREEVLADPRIDEILEEMEKLDIDFFIVSNGAALTERMLERLNSMRLCHLNVSVNSFDRMVHKGLSGGSELYPLVMENIERIARMNRRFTWSVSTVVTSMNVGELGEFVEAAVKLGVDGIRLLHLYRTEGDGRDWLDPGDYCKDLEKVRWELQGSGVWLRAFYPVAWSPECVAPWTQFWVTAGGDVYGCCWQVKALGNMDKQTAAEVWMGKGCAAERSRMRMGIPGDCTRCGEFQAEESKI